MIFCYKSLGDILMPFVENIPENKGNFGAVGTPNYSTFESDGTYVAKGDATTWKDINITLANLATGASTPDVAPLFGTSIRGYLFGAGTNGTSDEVHASGEEVNHWYMQETDIVFHVHFFNELAVGTTNKGVVWYYEVAWTNVLGQAVLASSGTIVFTYPDNTPAWTHTLFNLATLTGTGKHIGSQVSFMLRRVKNASNTYTGRIHPSSVGFHCQADTIGSRQIATK
jgi:hypothetical protein